jgi:NAD(P)-dependent dehydrogenase (short-subunit alcohol dehydrogenase family)
VTALVNNAATDYTVRVADLEVPRFDRVFDVNVRGPFLCAREAVRRMSTERGGHGGTIVNIGSISARYGGLPEDVVYTATKGALDAFTMGLAREVAREGIRVCCVRPGLTQTEIFDTNLGLEQVRELARKSVPLGRIGQPEEVANLVLWLCSDEASYVTSSIYDVCGGR